MREKRKREGGRERRVNGEYVESGRQDGGVPHYTDTAPHVNVCTDDHERNTHVRSLYGLGAHTHSHMYYSTNHSRGDCSLPLPCIKYRLCTSPIKKYKGLNSLNLFA